VNRSEAITIPGRAMLQASELHGATPSTLDDNSWGHLRPPEPCADVPYPSAALCRSSRSIAAAVGVNVTVEYVGVYWPNGARRYVHDLQRALDTCRGVDGQGRWEIIETGLAGRYSVLLRQRADRAGRAATRDTFIAIARLGRVLVVVADVGGEAGDGRRELVAELISPALRRTNFLL